MAKKKYPTRCNMFRILMIISVVIGGVCAYNYYEYFNDTHALLNGYKLIDYAWKKDNDRDSHQNFGEKPSKSQINQGSRPMSPTTSPALISKKPKSGISGETNKIKKSRIGLIPNSVKDKLTKILPVEGDGKKTTMLKVTHDKTTSYWRTHAKGLILDHVLQSECGTNIGLISALSHLGCSFDKDWQRIMNRAIGLIVEPGKWPNVFIPKGPPVPSVYSSGGPWPNWQLFNHCNIQKNQIGCIVTREDGYGGCGKFVLGYAARYCLGSLDAAVTTCAQGWTRKFKDNCVPIFKFLKRRFFENRLSARDLDEEEETDEGVEEELIDDWDFQLVEEEIWGEDYFVYDWPEDEGQFFNR